MANSKTPRSPFKPVKKTTTAERLQRVVTGLQTLHTLVDEDLERTAVLLEQAGDAVSARNADADEKTVN